MTVRGVGKTVDVDNVVGEFVHESKHIDVGSSFYSRLIGKLGAGLELHVSSWADELERCSLAAEQHGLKGVKVFVNSKDAIELPKNLFGREDWFRMIELLYQPLQ